MLKTSLQAGVHVPGDGGAQWKAAKPPVNDKKVIERSITILEIILTSSFIRYSTIWGGASLLTMLLSAMKVRSSHNVRGLTLIMMSGAAGDAGLDRLGLCPQPQWVWLPGQNPGGAGPLPLKQQVNMTLTYLKYEAIKCSGKTTLWRATGGSRTSLSRSRGWTRHSSSVTTTCGGETEGWLVTWASHIWFRLGQRTLPTGVQIDGGSDWICLNRQFAQYVVYSEWVISVSSTCSMF